MLRDPKAAAAMIVSRMHAPAADSAPKEDDGADDGAGLHAASSELLRAVHAHDADDLAQLHDRSPNACAQAQRYTKQLWQVT